MPIFRIALLLVTSLVLASVGWSGYRSWVSSQQDLYALRCRQARDNARWGELQRLGEEWTRWDRKSADAWLFRADAAQHLGNLESTAIFLDTIPESSPKFLPALVSLSALQFGGLKRPFDGVKTCERMLTIDPRTTAAHQQLIEFYAISLQRRNLEHHIRFAIRCRREPPSAYIYLFLIDTMRVAGGVESNENWLKAFPEEELFRVARVLQMPEPENGVTNSERNDKFTLVDNLFANFPRNLELLAYKIDLCIRRGNIDELIDLLRQLPVEADEDSRFWRAKGWMHVNRREIPEAKQALTKAIELFPMDWNARNWLADVLRSDGNLADADAMQSIVRTARRLRQRITTTEKSGDVSTELLTEIAGFARQCDDKLVVEGLNRRLWQQ